MLLQPDSPLCFGHDVKELDCKPVEGKRAGGTIGLGAFGFHNKRNQTIGLGECEQLDLVVTESVIRWSFVGHHAPNFLHHQDHLLYVERVNFWRD